MNTLPDGVTSETWCGIEALRVETPFSVARISLHGGQLLSFTPNGFDDLLWVSPTTSLPPKAIRGGVPVCWPWFGPHPQDAAQPMHGFARLLRWRLEAVEHGAGFRGHRRLRCRQRAYLADPSDLQLPDVRD